MYFAPLPNAKVCSMAAIAGNRVIVRAATRSVTERTKPEKRQRSQSPLRAGSFIAVPVGAAMWAADHLAPSPRRFHSLPSMDDLAEEARSWLEDHWDPDLSVGAWWELLGHSGWAVPHWPTESFGMGLHRDAARVVANEIRAGSERWRRRPGSACCWPVRPSSPTGPTSRRQRYLEPIVTGKESWCQLFSEPNAGSDLAGLQCRADRDGDLWRFTGQKVWTSGGHMADLGMLLVRTDPDVPKHRGISYFAIEMDQPGVDVRPLREMTGHALFNEVFLDEAEAHDDALIGGLDNGWAVANTTLANERAGLGAGGVGAAAAASPGTKVGHLERRAGDFAAGPAPERVLSGTRGIDQLLALADQQGKTADPVLRDRLMRLHSYHEIARYTALRSKAAKAAGRGPGPEANTAKLAMSRITRLAARAQPRRPWAPTAPSSAATPRRWHLGRHGAVQPGGLDLRRVRRDPAQHHRRTGARPPGRTPRRQGPPLQRDPQELAPPVGGIVGILQDALRPLGFSPHRGYAVAPPDTA